MWKKIASLLLAVCLALAPAALAEAGQGTAVPEKAVRVVDLAGCSDVLKVMGYNDSSVCLCCEPELSSVDNRLGPICDQIVEVVLGVLAGREMPQRTMFTAQLALRGSA